MHTTIIKGLIMAAIPVALLLGAPVALADKPTVTFDAQGGVSDSVHDAWTVDSLHAYPHRGAAVWSIDALGTVRAADMAVRKTESWFTAPQSRR